MKCKLGGACENCTACQNDDAQYRESAFRKRRRENGHENNGWEDDY